MAYEVLRQRRCWRHLQIEQVERGDVCDVAEQSKAGDVQVAVWVRPPGEMALIAAPTKISPIHETQKLSESPVHVITIHVVIAADVHRDIYF